MAEDMPVQGTNLRNEFWKLSLESLNKDEWEALCDGCGRCCLKKFVDEDSDQLLWTRVVCRYLDQETRQCGCYQQRSIQVPDCIDVKALNIASIDWMPDTCAYRLRALDKPLYPWHPLLAKNADDMEDANIPVTGKVISEDYVHPQGYEEHVIRWINPES